MTDLAQDGRPRVSVELRSVNHRFFNATVRLPSELSRWESEVREALRKRVSRGHISLSARIERGVAGAPAIDEARFAAYVEMLRALQSRYLLDGNIDITAVLRMPDVMSSISEGEDGDVRELIAIVEASASALSQAREEEGARLATYVRSDCRRGAARSVRAPQRLLGSGAASTAVVDLAQGQDEQLSRWRSRSS
jgi:uncharacterized protein (TIGR00255 family)